MEAVPDLDKKSICEGLAVSLVFDFVQAINVACRTSLSYPSGHRAVIDAFGRVMHIAQKMLEIRGQLTLGIAKDALMLDTTFLNRKDQTLAAFSRTLFDHGICGLTLLRGLELNELIDFIRIISQKRPDIARQGGVAALCDSAAIRHIQLRLIDYSLFHATDSPGTGSEASAATQSSLFWWSFIKGLCDGTLDPNGISVTTLSGIDPEVLADILNKKELQGKAKKQGIIDFSILQSMQTEQFTQLSRDPESSERLARFVGSLDGPLRQQFMEKFFASLSAKQDIADSVLSSLPDTLILDALENHTSKACYVPPNILEILLKLKHDSASQDVAGTDTFLNDFSLDDLAEKLKLIFKEDEIDRFVPLDYQKVLHKTIAADTLSAPELQEVESLRQTLNDHTINVNLTSIIVSILTAGHSGPSPDSIKKSLQDRCRYLVRDGDFEFVLHICAVIEEKTAARLTTDGSTDQLQDVFCGAALIEEILDAPARWGKEKFSIITELITKIGPPFVEPLLDRLEKETNRTIRQLFLDLLISLGPLCRDPVIARLQNKSWYFLRNLIIILRELNDPTVSPHLHRLVTQQHPKVKSELLLTLIRYEDPLGPRLLLEEMNSDDPGRSTRAVMLAGKARSPEITQRLLQIVKKKGFNKTTFEIKKAAVQALADMADPLILPDLVAELEATSLLFRNRAQMLKLEIIESLKKYPAAQVSSILKQASRSGSQAVANKATTVMKLLQVEGL